METIYLDHAATTPLDVDVLEAMHPYFLKEYGNPSSVHQLGRKARHTVEKCRARIADVLGASPGDIVFTSGGTESNNFALRMALSNSSGGLITSAAEHDAVLETAQRTAERGIDVSILPVDSDGTVRMSDLEEALTRHDEKVLVSLMYVNNEIGTVSSLTEIAELCQRYDAYFHTDAVQAAGLYPLKVDELGVDLLSLSAHKFYGPKGVGLLFIRGGLDVDPLVVGGGQERERRAGTENVPAIVGMTEALEKASSSREKENERLRMLRRKFVDLLDQHVSVPYILNGTTVESRQAPHIVNIAFPSEDVSVDGEMLLLNMDMEGVCVSSGSACASGAVSPSHVLRAIGLDQKTASAAIRFSMGTSTKERDVVEAAKITGSVLDRMTRGVEKALQS